MQHILSALIAIIIATASSLAAPNEPKGYTGNLEAIVGFPELGLNTTQGYRFNKYWSVGANTGLNVSWAGYIVPLCAVGQFNLPLDNHTSLLLNTKAGFAYPLNHEYPLGSNFALGIGCRSHRVALQLALNFVFCRFQGNAYIDDEVYNGYATPQIRIAYIFGTP